MPVQYPPRPGSLVMCDFSEGFKSPEMVKKRPVVVLASADRRSRKLATVVPLSTVQPDPIHKYHLMIDPKRLPRNSMFFGKQTWLKGDMLYTVRLQRLDWIREGRAKDRNYYLNRFSRSFMEEVYACVLHGLNLSDLANQLQK